ncbi:hypothetical protein [Nocardia sp. NBC_01329]|uniref:hypothetical protein n=1 Tax=Nocardia sp. NBC_01329 TaxID=2903594 RepID=UPI002E14011A|nr:hypothetical protein OG405_18745 [Nocardia sp. NBC_01329]
MAQLWVKTHGGDWLRADQIIEIGTESVRERGPHDDAGAVEVVARLAVATGSGQWDYDRGSGAVGPSIRVLGRYPSEETAERIADQLVLILLSANKNAQIMFDDEEVQVRPVHDRTGHDTPYNGRALDTA